LPLLLFFNKPLTLLSEKADIMKVPGYIYQVDAFTSDPFKGNPAGVCLLDHEPSDIWMQNIAMEMNLSETAFVFP
jgi:PhzF family phenazine biosynthesis protein